MGFTDRSSTAGATSTSAIARGSIFTTMTAGGTTVMATAGATASIETLEIVVTGEISVTITAMGAITSVTGETFAMPQRTAAEKGFIGSKVVTTTGKPLSMATADTAEATPHFAAIADSEAIAGTTETTHTATDSVGAAMAMTVVATVETGKLRA